ncbi:MAG: pilus assembly protein PilP [Pseudomonadota bacterium]
MRHGPLLALLLAGAMLAGCSGPGQEELRQWMTEQRLNARPKIEPLAEPFKFAPFTYSQMTAIEPFSNAKLTQALKRESTAVNSNAALIAPELGRRKEPLEASPLDSVTLVGSLLKVGQPVALVRVDNLLYQVRVGNYLGQNYGRITKISETELALREIVQDAAGEWTERIATLQLREASK